MIKQIKISRDVNGNKTCKAICEGGSFSVQTLCNMPLTHRNGKQYYTAKELHNYVDQFGTERQKRLVSFN
jgi:hypothetical protein